MSAVSSKFWFADFPLSPVEYQETPPDDPKAFVHFTICVEKTTTKTVFVKESVLDEIGISASVWKMLKADALPGFIKQTHTINRALEQASHLVAPIVRRAFQTFFSTSRPMACRVISAALHQEASYVSDKPLGIPGIYIDNSGPYQKIFINLKWTPLLGEGTYSKVRKVVWLNGGDNRPVLVAKKVLKEADGADEAKFFKTIFENELATLKTFTNKRGIISLIAGGDYGKKKVLFLPLYEYSLCKYLTSSLLDLNIEEKYSIAEQWLCGLAAIAEKGVHADLSWKNLLFKRKSKEEWGKVEAVIADFGSFQPFPQEQYGLTTCTFGSPEYFKDEKVTPKQDVWALGLSLYGLFSQASLLYVLNPYGEETMSRWTSRLAPNWINRSKFYPDTPLFLQDLINAMLDPRYEQRPSPKEAHTLFLQGIAAYTQTEHKVVQLIPC